MSASLHIASECRTTVSRILIPDRFGWTSVWTETHSFSYRLKEGQVRAYLDKSYLDKSVTGQG